MIKITTIKNHMKKWNFLYKGNDTAKAIANAACVNHEAKMAGIMSFSTSVILNKRCQARCKDKKSICFFCFAVSLANARANLAKKLARNTALFTSKCFAVKDIPIINYEKWPLVRFESFGDLNNTTQVYNYFLMASVNEKCKFALWTKNPDIIEAAIAEYGLTIPKNLVIIYSSPKVNECNKAILSKYEFIDKVFTVYDKATSETVNINCGARDCRKCQRCYHLATDSIVNEILK